MCGRLEMGTDGDDDDDGGRGIVHGPKWYNNNKVKYEVDVSVHSVNQSNQGINRIDPSVVRCAVEGNG